MVACSAGTENAAGHVLGAVPRTDGRAAMVSKGLTDRDGSACAWTRGPPTRVGRPLPRRLRTRVGARCPDVGTHLPLSVAPRARGCEAVLLTPRALAAPRASRRAREPAGGGAAQPATTGTWQSSPARGDIRSANT